MAESKNAEPKPAESSIVKKEDKPMEFIPHGGKDPIKLTIGIIKRLIAAPTKNNHKCSDEDAMKFLMMCSARRLNPFEGDAFLIGYDSKDGPKFNLITAHQAFLKRAELNQEYDGMESGVIVGRDGKTIDLEGDFTMKHDELLGGWAKVYFKSRSRPMHKRLNLGRFNTGMSQWAKDPAGMICKCAEADALRSSFPTMLGSLYIREELEREQASPSVTPIFKDEARKSEATDVEVVTEEDPVLSILDLCDVTSVKDSEVVVFMKSIGMLEDGATTLREATAENLKHVVKNWTDIQSRIKETRGADAK